MPAPTRRWLSRALKTIAVLLAIWTVGSFGLEHITLHPRHWSVGPPPSANGWAYRNVSFKDSAGLTLRGWWIPGLRHETVIMVHGWTSSRREPMGRADYLHQAGYNLLLFDLRGHGQSDGNYTTIGWQEPDDVRAAVTFARSQDPGPIALLGYSMGASTVVEEAAHDPRVSAVVEDSGFDTLANAFGVYFHNMTLLPAFPFDRLVMAIGQLDLRMNIAAVR
ncbi:MAG TPA: alpha/beta fold hydrolase, partial [Candidatus Limnocylindrales bacterium]|nr:alpha/beta fold hydrolase [Candidatus Limnocylindrales bacterium]